MSLYTNDQICEVYRTAIKTAADLMSTSLSGFERLQHCQSNATQELLAAHADAVKELEGATSVHELVEIGARLGWQHVDKFMSCWSDLHATFGMNQMELIREAQAKSLETVEEAGRMIEGVPLAPGVEQIMTAVRLAVNTTRSSYAAGVRAIEEVEREAAARLETAAQAAEDLERAATQGDQKQAGQNEGDQNQGEQRQAA